MKKLLLAVMATMITSTAAVAQDVDRPLYHEIWNQTQEAIYDTEEYGDLRVARHNGGYKHAKFTIASAFSNEAASAVIFDGADRDKAVQESVQDFLDSLTKYNKKNSDEVAFTYIRDVIGDTDLTDALESLWANETRINQYN